MTGIFAQKVVKMGGPTPPMTDDENWLLFELEFPDLVTIEKIFIDLKWCGN